VLIDNLPDAQAAEQVRLSVEAALSQPLASVAMPGPGAPRLAGAVGLAVHPRDADTAEDLIGAADHDMYARKRAQQG